MLYKLIVEIEFISRLFPNLTQAIQQFNLNIANFTINLLNSYCHTIIYVCSPGKIKNKNDKMSMASCQLIYLKIYL